MGTGKSPAVQELLPAQAWDCLEQDPDALLIDVRTKAEWSFVGKPDLSRLDRSTILVEWARYPDMSVNPRFVDEVEQALAGNAPTKLLFICRSGVRSMNAAKALLASYAQSTAAPDLVNVSEGFEGDLDPHGRRGGLNGWKAHGLPWKQS